MACIVKSYTFALAFQEKESAVIDMKREWNGYRYWMSYSPYPNADGAEENPCIGVSNDMIHWTTPDGLYNPYYMKYKDQLVATGMVNDGDDALNTNVEDSYRRQTLRGYFDRAACPTGAHFLRKCCI